MIEKQRANEIIETVEVEEASKTVSERLFHLPHRPVIRESPLKIRNVYNTPGILCLTSTSLNECLKTVSILQNQLWDILLRSRFRPIIICGTIEKPFLEIRIRVSKRDTLRFYWVSNIDLDRIELNYFTGLVFGLTQSRLIVEVTLKEHFNNYKSVFPELVKKIRIEMYVEDLVSGELS